MQTENSQEKVKKNPPWWLVQLLGSCVLAALIAVPLGYSAYVGEETKWTRSFDNYNDFIAAQIEFAGCIWLFIAVASFILCRLATFLTDWDKKRRSKTSS